MKFVKNPATLLTAINLAIAIFILSSPDVSSQVETIKPHDTVTIYKDSYHDAYAKHQGVHYDIESDINIYPNGTLSFRGKDNLGSNHYLPIIILAGDWSLEIIDEESLE